jgi:predicted branched-subunit amino acid permease
MLCVAAMKRPPKRNFASPRAAFLGGMRDYLGVSTITMAAAFVGFGATAEAGGLTIWQGLFATAGIVLVPAQLVTLELYAAGAGLLNLLLAVAFVSARLLPMTVALMPVLREGRSERLRFYLGAFPLATIAWSYGMARGRDLEPAHRFAYYLGVALFNYTTVIGGTALGYLLADGTPQAVKLGLVFLVPVFFLLTFTAEAKGRSAIWSLAFGALLGPPLYLLTPAWSILGAGLIGGSLAFALGRSKGAPHG